MRGAAVAEAAGPIAAEGVRPIGSAADSADPIAGFGVGIAEDTGCPSTALDLARDSLGVAAGSPEVAADSLERVVGSPGEAAGPDSPVGLGSLGSGGLAGDGPRRAVQ